MRLLQSSTGISAKKRKLSVDYLIKTKTASQREALSKKQNLGGPGAAQNNAPNTLP